MTPPEAVQLVRIVRQLWPSMKMDDFTPDAWHIVLDDIDLDDALKAVRHLSRSRSGYIAPADIRRRVAAEAGLLPLPEAQALTAATRVASDRGVGASKLDIVTQQAYRDMGGATAFDAPMGVLRAQWAKVYNAIVEGYTEELLAGDLGAVVARQRLMAAPPPARVEECPLHTNQPASTCGLCRSERIGTP